MAVGVEVEGVLVQLEAVSICHGCRKGDRPNQERLDQATSSIPFQQCQTIFCRSFIPFGEDKSSEGLTCRVSVSRYLKFEALKVVNKPNNLSEKVVKCGCEAFTVLGQNRECFTFFFHVCEI